MTAQRIKPQRIWTVAEAQARLPEILRLAAEEGPQRISAGTSFVILAERQPTPAPPRKPMGQWLVENMPRGIDLEIPSRRESEREIPFIGRSGRSLTSGRRCSGID